MKLAPPLLATMLLTAVPALAQTATTPAGHPATGNQPARKPDAYRATLDQRIARMRQRLRIMPQQEGAWNAFTQVMQDNADAIRTAYQKRADTLGKMTASENLRNYAQIEQDRLQGLQKLSVAFDTLYGQLSGEQKQDADDLFRNYGLRQAQHRAAHAK